MTEARLTGLPHRSRRLLAPGIHLLASIVVAALAASVIFLLWYPPPFATIAGGLNLFFILVGVDVVMGPILTATIADGAKPRRTFLLDLAVIIALQVAALSYGVYSLAMARPVLMSFEVDRFRVLAASDIDPVLLPEASPSLRELSWVGPKLIATAQPTDRAEILRSMDLALGGLDISYVPKNWRDYASMKVEAFNAAKPVSTLLTRYPEQAEALAVIAARAHQPVDALRFLPVMSRHAGNVAVLSPKDSAIVGYLPVEGFF